MKMPKQAYTTECKELAVKRIRDGQSVNKVCLELGSSDQTQRDRVKAVAWGKPNDAGGKLVQQFQERAGRWNSPCLACRHAIHLLADEKPRGFSQYKCADLVLQLLGYSA